MRLQTGTLANFGGHAFGTPLPVRQMGQPRGTPPLTTGGPPVASPTPSGPAAAALAAVNRAQQDLRGIERNLTALEQALGPEAAVEAVEQAQASVTAAWENYVAASEEMA